MFAAIFDFVISLIANAVSTAFDADRKTRPAESFERRAKKFHSHIAPMLLNKIIPEKSLYCYDKLERYTDSAGGRRVLPYIKLADFGEFRLSSDLVETNKLRPKDDKFIGWLKGELGKTVNNNPTFALRSISKTGELIVGVSDYESTVSDCDKCYFDLIRYFPESGKLPYFFSYKNGKSVRSWINRLEKAVKERSFSHYSASIGCSVLTVFKSTDGEYKYWIKKNSNRKGSAAFESHVIPSFMFQPVSSRREEQKRELDLELAIVKEYGEEILGLSELESAPTVDVLLKLIDDNPVLKCLRDHIKNGDAELHATSISLDVFRLRPEITFLLVLHDDLFSSNMELNWESVSVEPIHLSTDSEYYDVIESVNAPLCPPGIAALVAGRDRALQILEERSARSRIVH